MSLTPQDSLMHLLMKEKEDSSEIGLIQSMLAIRSPDEIWRGVIAIPPGSLIEKITAEFDKKTNIPLEIPFFVFFQWVAGYLLHNNVSIKILESTVFPDIWTVILADSGSGKTFTEKTMKFAIPVLSEFSYDMSGIVSTGKLIDDLVENNRKLFQRDEFSELYKQIIYPQGPLMDLKDKMLQLYNNGTIERKGKKETTTVCDTAIVFLGMTVLKSFTALLTADDVINGFAQRFGFVVAEKDHTKKMIDYPIYDIDTSDWNEKWFQMTNSIKHKEYIASPDAIEAFKITFSTLATKDMDESFYRRTLWKAHKYALVYHILLGKGEKQEVGPEAYGWAARVIHMLIGDTLKILKDHGMSDIEKKVQLAEKLRKKMEEEGKKMTPRDMVQRIRSIANVAEAKAILSII